ncbi:MAG TPA: RNA-binding cell elongation regulator Jag/EloR [Anaerolineales bacterium]|nr:RNA-binding cell elongation regulator Jag/EloR [Anaerolineales bacterium]HMX17817.1 RNA-binding cell elongation regulator Jag/EloR [Anaerolineales bacterium]HMZ44778.1 RNA-binding cell elongation regulator Jag/EloR [Anaerolineales bacterium]HNA53290.1 RNA-binding cell elongation regulator Jag/EloR [Anaerolineales bacterium]HNC87791.1 RNA-binding cell elongation regulator Jag/EloR [Anaerolineales bacterium]
MSGTTLEIIAPTVEEALAQGLAQLGLTADAVSVEVLDSGSKGLFGLGGRQVRVRLTVNPPPVEETHTPAPARQKPADRPKGKPAPAQKAESAPKAQREPKPRTEKKPAPEAPAPVKQRPLSEGSDALLDTTESVISKLIHHLGMKAQVSAHYDESSTDDRRVIQVDVRGDDLSALIGRQAETLNAFQYVASLIVGKETQKWVQLVVDVEGYRSRREKQVRQIALRMVDQVIKTGRKATLEPMTASERRAIHIELRGHPAVTTESVGEEPHRKVVILPKE